MSFFSLDSKFSQIMGRVFDLMMLNIIFLIMCIPIVNFPQDTEKLTQSQIVCENTPQILITQEK